MSFFLMSQGSLNPKSIRLDPRHDVNGFVHVMHNVNSVFHVMVSDGLAAAVRQVHGHDVNG